MCVYRDAISSIINSTTLVCVYFSALPPYLLFTIYLLFVIICVDSFSIVAAEGHGLRQVRSRFWYKASVSPRNKYGGGGKFNFLNTIIVYNI